MDIPRNLIISWLIALSLIMALFLIADAAAYADKLIIIDIGAKDFDVACDGEHPCFLPYHTIAMTNEPVLFYNTDEQQHSIVFGDPTITIDLTGMQTLDPGDSYNTTFRIPGEYYYYCSIHPWKTGFIEVQLAGEGALRAQVALLEERLTQRDQYIDELEGVIDGLLDEIDDLKEDIIKKLLDQ